MRLATRPGAGFRQAATWAFAQSWGQQGIRAAVSLVLAALLGPTVFGVMALALALIQLLQLFLEQGLSAAIIQRRDLEDSHLDSAFWLVFGSSLGLFGVCLGMRQSWAELNHLPQVATILPYLGLALPIRGLAVVQDSLLQREMNFRALALRSGAAATAGGAIGVAAALLGWGVWSLVAQELSAAAIGVTLLWGISSWRPGLRISRRHLGDLLRFSGANLVGRIGLTLEGVVETTLVGSFFGPTTVGLYRLGRRLMETLLSIATRSIQAVSLPELARLQHLPDEFRQGLIRCLRASAVLSIPALLLAAAFADSIMAAVGHEWAGGGPTLEVLCFLGAVQSLTLLVGPLLQALFRPGLLSVLIWARGVCLSAGVLTVGLLFAGAPANAQAFSVAASRAGVSLLLFVPLELWALMRFGRLSPRALLGVVAPSFVAGLAGALVGLIELHWLPGLPPRLELVLYAPTAGGAAMATLLMLDARVAELARGAVRRLRAALAAVWRPAGAPPRAVSREGGGANTRHSSGRES